VQAAAPEAAAAADAAEDAVAAAADDVIQDRVGLGWRPEYAVGILCNTDQVDLVEVIADNFLREPKVLRTLAAQIPVSLHAVSLGLASSLPVETRRLEKLARLFDICTPESWSEHFAFVRAGGFEIGHLAAPPRNDETAEGAFRNLQLARRVIGAAPLLENIATLIEPPCSAYGEWDWIGRILQASSCGLLLDLHNLLANCVNFGGDPDRVLRRLPHDKIGLVHLSGGKWIADPENEKKLHLLDDHLNDPPDEVYRLLALLAELCPNSLSVIIERDGNYPAFELVLEQVRRTRQALALGRQRRKEYAIVEGLRDHG
jgi:uncharacterized protein (UPF0276 family)